MSPKELRALGRRIRREREARGLPVERVAERMDVAASVVYRWELGYVEPVTGSLIRLCRAIGCDIRRLIDD